MSDDRQEKRRRQAVARTTLPELPELRTALQPLPRGFTQQQLELHRRGYEKVGNPVHVWAAYRCARRAGQPLPLWIWRYLDSVAEALLDPAAADKSAAEAATAALEVDRGAGERTSFQEFADSRWLDYGAIVTLCIAEGDKEFYAIETVAKELGVSKSAVRRGLIKYRELCQED